LWLARRLPAVIFIRRLYGGLAGQYGGVLNAGLIFLSLSLSD